MRLFLLIISLVLIACDPPPPPAETEGSGKIPAPLVLPAAKFAGRDACAGCHEPQIELFNGSHHDLAMQHVAPETVLGNFADAQFTYNGITSSFFRRDDAFYVNTDGEDGELKDYEIKYVFGVEPLQQYLVETHPDRLQALSIAWDSRPESSGGQQWFHLYPDESIDYQDPLHWTSRHFNWNYMCAECHSTDLRKNYDLDTDRYSTTWAEIDVSCEACHGPASNHVKLARTMDEDEFMQQKQLGLITDYSASTRGNWIMSVEHPIAALDSDRDNDILIETCARCHARRSRITEEYSYTQSFHDQFIVSLLDDGLYHPDGQIDDEVYVYGSFLQSRMYMAGVSCTDCHDPHSLKLKAEDNALCLQCHKGEVYHTSDHHFHEADTAAAQCTTCHMPAKTYMVIDPRRDHSFKVPRPDLTEKTATPNICNQCHTDQSAQWAAEIIREKSGTVLPPFHYAEAFHDAGNLAATASLSLQEVAMDPSLPGIVRATAMNHLAPYPGPEQIETISAGLADPNPLIRRAGITALNNLAPEDRFRLAARLLDDPVKSVRISAAGLLAGLNNTAIPAASQQSLSIALREHLEAQRTNNDRAFAHVNTGTVYLDTREYKKAEMAYRQAIDLEPDFLPAYANLAELYRIQGDEDQVQSILKTAMEVDETFAAFHYAMGLSLVRQQQYDASLDLFQQAHALAPADQQIVMVYALALNTLEQADEAMALLEDFLQGNPNNARITMTLATLYRDHGQIDKAMDQASRLLALMPGDPQATTLLEQLTRMRSDQAQ